MRFVMRSVMKIIPELKKIYRFNFLSYFISSFLSFFISSLPSSFRSHIPLYPLAAIAITAMIFGPSFGPFPGPYSVSAANYKQVHTWMGPMWVGVDFVPPIYELEEFMAQFGNTVAVYYENMATGFVFTHNADRRFFGASATKAPFALYIYQKAERGETDLNSVHTFTSADHWGGSGVIRRRYSVGATFTQRELLYLMLAPSDNIATRILRRIHGLYGYRDYIYSIGGDPHFIQNIAYSYISATEAGVYITEIFRYIESNGRYSHEFRDNLLANRYPFIISDYPVASKSGWASNFGGAWHDMAIVYAPSPYVLVLLSTRAGNQSDRRVYDAISMFVQDFNDRWFMPY